MKRSGVQELAESLGFDPQDIGRIVVSPDEIQVRQKAPGTGIWFIQDDDFPVEDTFWDILRGVNATAPIQLEGVTFIRIDWRGLTVQIDNGLSWSVPWGVEAA